MSKRNCPHVQELFPEIEAMIQAGKTQREIAEYFGFKDKTVKTQYSCTRDFFVLSAQPGAVQRFISRQVLFILFIVAYLEAVVMITRFLYIWPHV